MDVSICVVSYNTRDLLAECLRSVYAHVRGHGDAECIVVDNASVDGSAEMVRQDFPDARLIECDVNRGFAAGVNQALAVSQSRYVLLLNSDATLLPGAIDALQQFMDEHPRAGIVGGQVLNADGSFQNSFADFPSLLGEVLLASKIAPVFRWPTYPSYPAHLSQAERLVDWVSGAFLMARRSAINLVGLMDEEYFMYAEETDWCYRMRRAGWTIGYVPRAKILHLNSGSARRAPERRRGQVYRSKWLFFRKHRGLLTATVFRAVVLIVSVFKLLGWAAVGLMPGRREHSRQQVRSYAWVLSEL